jgi:anthranilate synthase/aminodeoxychorismate synthase-like glutamine amidotransferase
MLLLIDNYDSFTYNLVHFLGDLGARCWCTATTRSRWTRDGAQARRHRAVARPCTPNEAGICMDLIKAAAKAQVPLFGVCLGHQAIGQVFGGKVVRAPTPMHGKLSGIQHRARACSRTCPRRSRRRATTR